MERNYPGTGFGDLGAGAGWSYERSAKASLVYGSSRSSHPESELLHRQAYATPHPLQGYATNHHPGSSGQGGAWGAAGRSLGLSGLFDTGLHHASPSAPDASVMNLISALESRGPQPPPSASSLLSQFRTPSWQTAMHTPAPAELFISGALPGSGSFPSSSALSAYQHPASFSSRSFPAASLSLQDTPTFSPTSNGLLSPHDPLLHIKAPSQSSLGFDRLLSSQGAAAAAYRGSQDPTGATSAQASSARHLQSHQFNLLSSQLQDQSSQLYNASVFSSAQAQSQSQSQSNSAQERAVPRQDSVIKHYQRPTPSQSQLSSSAAHSLQHYLNCGGAGYQQIATHHRHAGLSCSPLGYGSPVPPVKTPTSALTGQTPPQQQAQSYSPGQPPTSHLGYPDTRNPSSQSQSYHNTSSKTKTDTSMLGVGNQRSQEEVDDDEEFLIQHLLQAQASSSPQTSHHHSQQQQQQPSQQSQPPSQAVPSTTDANKGLSYDMSKSSEERYHPQSVIRTHSATSSSGAASGASISGLDSELEMSLKKQQHHHQQQQQQQRSERSVGSSRSSGRGSNEQVHSHLHHHESLSSVVHYGRGDPYSQHSLAAQHTSHNQHVSSHSQLPHSQMDLQKKSQERSEISYPRKTPEVQQQHSQSQGSLIDSPTDQSRQPPHLLQSVLSHTTRNKLEPHQQHHKMDSHRQHPQHHKMDTHQSLQQHAKLDSHSQHQPHSKMEPIQHQHHKMDSHSQQQHSISQQQAALESAAGRLGSSKHQAPSQSQTTQLQLQLQSQALEVAAAHYNHGPPPHQHEQSQVKQSSVVSSLDMLERSLSQTSNTDVEDRRGGGSGGRSSGNSERQQRQLPTHHHSTSELHSFLSEPDIGLSTPSHMHHLSQHHSQTQQHQHPHHSHPQASHSHHIPPSASGHSQGEQAPLSAQLTPQQSQLDQQRSEQHQFDTVSPVEKADQNQQSNRFVPLTSICFPDSLLQDEDRSFFPGMEDMFCAEDYKSSCAGGAGPGQGEMNESHAGPEAIESMKAAQSTAASGAGSTGSYDMMGHHGNQGYEPYCHGLEEPSNNTMTLDLDSLKTHELPSTVNTEQLGLIQSQPPALGMGSNNAGPNSTGGKMTTGPGGTNSSTGSGGLQSPIFCSSRPKKLLKSSSFHLLKERRDPNTLPKKSYAQEYEFEDDEDKADQPADIRLNSRRLPDLLPDLVSSCRKSGAGGSLSPLMGDMDFYHSSGYSSIGSHSLMPQEGPKKRGRKPTRPKREGPPRPRGRPRIRPMPEPYTPRGMLNEMSGSVGAGAGAGFSVEGRGRGRGRGGRGRGGRREDMFIEMSSKQEHLHHHQLHPQQQQLHQQPQHEPIPPLKIKLPIGTMSSSDSLLRTDSLSGTDPGMSDGSVGSAPSLGLSPGPQCSADSSRNHEKNKHKSHMMSEMMSETVDEESLGERGDDKDSKAGFVASFLDFLKTGKRPPGLDISPGMEHDNGEGSPCKLGGLRPLSPAPPPPLPPPPFGDGEGNGGLALGSCPSPKRLEDELKRNLETLPSFSSDEEDSVGKNQDLQKSISSAISALYDTPQLTTMQAPLPSPPQTQATQDPLTPSLPPPALSPQPLHTPHTQPQSNEQDVMQAEELEMENRENEQRSPAGLQDGDMMEERASRLQTLGGPKNEGSLPEVPAAPATPECPSPPPSPASSSSPSHSPLPPLSLPSPPAVAEVLQQSAEPLPLVSLPSPAAAPPQPSSSPPHPPAPPVPLSQTPPPGPATQKESPHPSPESPASPEERPPPKITSLHLAQKQEDAAIAGESEEDESESGGEGIFRERDEFVVRVEDIRTLKLALQTGREPPPIWRVQKALLQKFSPEIKDGQRQFCATSNYLGYFGDAKRRYQRIYVKFLENVNKKDYVRVCSRRPWRRTTPLRRQSLPRMASPPTVQPPPRAPEKEERMAPPVLRELPEKAKTPTPPTSAPTTVTTTTTKEPRERKDVPAPAVPKAKEKEKVREAEKEKSALLDKADKRVVDRGKVKEERKPVERKEKAERPPKSKPVKVKAEPPPKKRKKWLKEVASSSDSESSEDAASENEMPVKGGVNNRSMREMFRSYVEMLVSTALDPDMIQALEDTDDELYLPPMRKIDSILSEQKRRLLRRVNMSSQQQEILHAYPQIIVDPLDPGVVRVRLSGDAYNRKTLNRVKKTLPKPQDLKLSSESYRKYSLYHSLHHYKYHTFLQCKKETNTIEQAAEDPGQEEVVQQCMANQSWLDTLFSSFIDLLTLSTKA
uniref:DUF4211 domain-containing protein n=1 Tax=Knipowitschia caucasica TaxID=637954 RepID=A0AAV2LAG4_KNICA